MFRVPPPPLHGLLAPIAAFLVFLISGSTLTAQICTGTAPPCVLTNGYAGPATDAAFNRRQGVSACPPVVTSVTTHSASDSEINLNMTVAAAFGSSCSFPQSFTFTGYFVVPAHDSTPTVASAGYPGGALTVSANCTSTPCTNGMIWAVVPSSTSAPDSLSRGLGTLYAYTALPNSNDLLALDWNSADTWCASSFARPTVVNGSIFTPTYAVSYGTRTFSSCPTTTTTGIPFPSGILVYH
jgi:hypothetical protein